MTTREDQLMTNTLDAPGARLHYEVRGTGPALLVIPGGAADGAGFSGLADALADRYTVITYDPRGLGRSVLDGPPVPVRVTTQADDAHRLLSAVGTEPAFVFASSGGAMTGLTLAVAHPEQVRTLVVHEPPITELLGEREQFRAQDEELHETWRTQGTDAAIAKFLADAGLDSGSPDDEPSGGPDSEMLAMMKQMRPNFDFFFGYMITELGAYEPDIAALRKSDARIVVAGGIESKGQVAHRAAGALAEALGTGLVDFPGHHMGTPGDPSVFAGALHSVFAAQDNRL